MTLIAEDLALLLLDDRSGKRVTNRMQFDLALGGALLAELAVAEHVELAPLGPLGGARVVAADHASTPDQVLYEALRLVAEKPRSARDVVDRLSKRAPAKVLARLEQRGMLRHETDTILGFFRTERWPAVDVEHEAAVRAGLADVLIAGSEPDPRTGALIALLAAVDQAHKQVVADGLSPKQVKQRAKHLAEGAWAPTAVTQAIQAVQAAVTAAAVAAIAVGGAAGA